MVHLSVRRLVTPRGMKIFFPEIPLRVQPRGNTVSTTGKITFLTTPNQSKYQIKRYLEQVYGVGVIKVNTMIYQGKIKRRVDRKGWYQRPAYKKVIVTIDNSEFLDRGGAGGELERLSMSNKAEE